MTRPVVLIVEPRKALREQLRDTLEETFDVLAAQTENGALTGLAKHHPSAILLALNQRHGGGLELASKLRDQGTGIPPFIVVYGDAASNPELPLDLDLKARYGVDRFLTSGVTIRLLETILTERFQAGWHAATPAKSEEEKKSASGWTNPMLTTEAVSARKAPEERKKGFSLRRLFGR